MIVIAFLEVDILPGSGLGIDPAVEELMVSEREKQSE